MFKRKPKIVIVSLSSCEGCQFVLLDLAEKFFDFLKKVELLDFRLLEDKEFPKGKIDIAFVEGNPITEENTETLKKIRKQAKLLVVLGNCAALGGIPEIANYSKNPRVSNKIKEIDNFVKVDYTIKGCPISGEEFLEKAKELIKGKIPEDMNIPVCTECSFKGKPECFLIKKEICFGLITSAGCKAICPENNFPCWGCRGILKTAKTEGLINVLEKFSKKEEIEEKMEIFGIKDDIIK